jgi:hypothetical protein
VAFEEVVLQLVISKCLTVLLYGVEACPMNTSETNPFNFIINRFFMKLFITNNTDIIAECRIY